MNEIINDKRTVNPRHGPSPRLAGTEAEFWLNLQQAVDLWDALHSAKVAEIDEIQPASVG